MTPGSVRRTLVRAVGDAGAVVVAALLADALLLVGFLRTGAAAEAVPAVLVGVGVVTVAALAAVTLLLGVTDAFRSPGGESA